MGIVGILRHILLNNVGMSDKCMFMCRYVSNIVMYSS